MKSFKIILAFTGLFFLTLSTSLNAQTSCDTTPDVGQTVGRCFTMSGPGGDVASCNEYNDGEICYFTKPDEEPDPGMGG